ncbi:sarcosine oxidase subunit gamma [Plantactinospora sp. WMMB334]|uniref:sarcosine oxidase subunit gamma n=1 Tax=Plantactinospora sp. WMMB334 TaxID=3404119 RepID=UPI003B93C676
MTADLIIARSPLEEWTSAFARMPAGIALREVRPLTQLSLHLFGDGPAAEAVAGVLGTALPTTPCTYRATPDIAVLWMSPREWLVLAPPAGRPELARSLRAAVGPDAGAIVDVSAQRTTLDLSGPLASEVLARGCSIDLHPSVSPAGTCAQTLLALARVVLLVRDDTATEFRLLVQSSYAAYIAAWLLDACAEYRDTRS